VGEFRLSAILEPGDNVGEVATFPGEDMPGQIRMKKGAIDRFSVFVEAFSL
jgi:hypothetical protein